ncbi:MAG: LptF/LptG family permease [Candidatus Marinimicrobia bacterium]|jgi:lipopolysaccharide export system permease protein|nr:LptF/LptG family permease [Candidatus Neomarinimicrobiota bacterium]
MKRIPRLYFYIFREHLAPFFGSLFIISFLFLAQYLIQQLDKLVGKNLSPFVMIEFIILNLAWVVAQAVPMSVLISTLMAYGRLGEDNELTALRASGINFSKIIRPSLLFATLITIFLIFFNNNILPNANHKAKLLRRDISRKHPDLSIEAGYFLDDIPDYHLFVREKKNDTLKNILIYHTTKNNEQVTIYAKNGLLEVIGDKVILNLYDGEFHELQRNESDNYRILNFDKHKIVIPVPDLLLDRKDSKYRGDREMNIQQMLERVKVSRKYKNNIKSRMAYQFKLNNLDTTKSKLSDKKKILTKAIKAYQEDSLKSNITQDKSIFYKGKIRRLNNLKNKLESNTKIYGEHTKQENKYLVEIHKKISMPVACIIFVLIGAPLGMLSRKGNLAVAGSFSLAFFFVYWALLMGGERLSDRNFMSAWLAMWSANIIVGSMGLILTWFAIHERININILKYFKFKKNKK